MFFNNKLHKLTAGLALVFALISGLSLSLQAQVRTSRQTRVYSYKIPANTVIRVESDEELNSSTANVGDKFTTTVIGPVYSRGVLVIPSDSQIIGRVVNVKKAEKKGKPGMIEVEFVSLRMPDGTSRRINGSLISPDEFEGKVDQEGVLKGRSATKRNVAFIGGGAGVGALIGAIAGGGKGAAIGALIGAGLGTGGAYFVKGQDVKVKPGTEFGVILNQAVTIPAYSY